MHGAMRTAVWALAFLSFAYAAEPEPRPSIDDGALTGYTLTFRDEFDGNKLDETEWQYRIDTRFWSAQLARNVSVAEGCLRLVLKKEKEGKSEYTAGGVISRKTFKYGYYEARFRCPPGAGWHTSFWMMRYNWKQTSAAEEAVQELDVCEQDSVNPNRYEVNLHRWKPEPHKAWGHKRVETPDLSADFHVWGCLFTPKKIEYYFDGKMVQTLDATILPHGPQNIWLTSIAAPLGGTKAVDDTRLPLAAEFDYVRYYAPAGEAPAAQPATPEKASPPNATGATMNSNDLDLAAMIKPSPATAKFIDPEYYIWGGSMVRGDDGKCHLFYSRWPRKLGHNAWVTHSEIAHAVADAPTGPYTHLDAALPPRGKEFWDGLCTHNPTINRFDGKYYLYYMGNTGDGIATKSLNWVHRNNQRIGVAVADSPNGPWQRTNRPLIDATPGFYDALCCANPSVTRGPDGTYLMVYKAVGDKSKPPFGGPVVHIAATSISPTGPFEKHPTPVFTKEGVHFAAEDPFIWRGVDRYWAVVKDNAGHFTNAGKSLALFESANGLDWKLARHALVSTIQVRWADGTVQKLNSLERPQLYLENGRPTALFCAVDEDAQRLLSYNVQIPLGE